MNIIEILAAEFKLKVSQVEQTVALIDEGNTIPFIARYRKEVTGGMSDVVLRDLDESVLARSHTIGCEKDLRRCASKSGKSCYGILSDRERHFSAFRTGLMACLLDEGKVGNPFGCRIFHEIIRHAVGKRSRRNSRIRRHEG